jgi:hypothetical protein
LIIFKGVIEGSLGIGFYGISICDTTRKRRDSYGIAAFMLFSQKNTIVQRLFNFSWNKEYLQ